MSVDDHRDREGDAEERTGVGGPDQEERTWDPGQGRDDAGQGVDDFRDRAGDAEERTRPRGQPDDESLDDLAAADADPAKPTI